MIPSLVPADLTPISTPAKTDADAPLGRSEAPLAGDVVNVPRRRFKATLHETIEAAAPLWTALQKEGRCTAYQRLDWCDGIVALLMPIQKAKPLLVEIADETTGAPVMLLPLALIRRLGYSVITWLDLGVCDYAAPLVATGARVASQDGPALWAAIHGVLPRADLIRIDRISETIGRVVNPLLLLPGVGPAAMRAFGTPIDGPAETLFKRLGTPSANQSFRRHGRRLAREGEVRFVMAETEAQCETLFAALLDQRRQRFRELGRFDLLNRPEVRDFYHAAARSGLQDGPAKIFGLSVGDTWIATALGLVHDGTFHGILLAMDSRWRQFAPGLRLVTEIMMWSRRHDVGYFDFTVGDLPYKAEFGAQSRQLHQLAVARSLRGTAVLAVGRLASAAKSRLQAHPQIFETLRGWRQAMRRWAR